MCVVCEMMGEDGSSFISFGHNFCKSVFIHYIEYFVQSTFFGHCCWAQYKPKLTIYKNVHDLIALSCHSDLPL